MTASEQPSYEELLAENAALRSAVAELSGVVEVLRSQVEALKAQLSANSRNSSKPPSSDGLAKPSPKSLRGRSGRKPGRPKGGPGLTLDLVAEPDRVIRHRPGSCAGCGSALRDAAPVALERRQVFDVPAAAVTVTEHRVVSCRCACGTVTAGAAPAYASKTVQYGPRITGIAVYLLHGQFLSRARTAQALSDLFGLTLVPSTIGAMVKRVVRPLGPVLERVRTAIAGAPLAFFDETGMRVAGACHWLHSASTTRFSLLTVHRRRGREGSDAAGVLPSFIGIAVHDAWAPYDTYTGATHALCNAHLLRELLAVTETGRDADKAWATAAIETLLALKAALERAVHDAGGGPVEVDTAGFHTARLTQIAAHGIESTAQRETTLVRKHHALAVRLHARIEDYVRYARHPEFGMFFDNNPAEREIRMPKNRIKISGSMRTLTGAREFAAIRSYTATAAKHGLGVLDVLIQAAESQPWTPQTT
ncbi:IS66 family transposase [Actinospica robiniae]|uniref:IS66 family transposase n=1 Tax=Actinospica robiniae TaxID=304901 RepID=UPI00041A0A34|nr:IS66 family transposase [Actinospica robiniae]